MQSSFTHKPAGTIGDEPPAIPEYEGQDALSNLAIILQTVQGWRAQWTTASRQWQSQTLPHITMLLVALLAIGLSNLDLSWGTISAIRPLKYSAAALPETPAALESASLTLPSELRNIQDDVFFRAAVPNTIVPERSQNEATSAPISSQLQTYAVQSGDNISGIAAKFGLDPETIIWANPTLENNPDWLSVGQELTILPVNGVYHQVGGGDTIEGIAATFKTDPQLIIDHPVNALDADNPIIIAGQWLVVPGGSKPFKPRAVTAYNGPVPDGAAIGTGIFGWPASGEITQGYFGYHPGVDIGGWSGAPVLAADSGYVVAAGWDGTGYGLSVVVDHGNGFQTLYAHLQDAYVTVGANVSKGQQIAEMGSSGNSTGPHLHFEVRHGTVQRNPYGFLP